MLGRRAKPRRNEGRVQHKRIKARTVKPSADHLRYWDWLGEVFERCQCGCGRLAECVHHLLSQAPGKVGRRDHFFVVRLAHHCHNGGVDSVHLCGSEEAFRRVNGSDLVAISVSNLSRYRIANGEAAS